MLSEKQHYLEKELYELIQRDQKIFDFIQEGSLDGLWYWDLEKPEHEWMSPSFWKNFGYDPTTKKHLASEWQDLINQDDLKVSMQNFEEHKKNQNHPYDQIVRYTKQDGSIAWVRCRGLVVRDQENKPIRMIGVHNDITALKEVEEKLRISEQQFRGSFESSAAGMALVSPEGKWLRVNQALCDIVGYTQDELLQCTFQDITHPDDLDKDLEQVQQVLEGTIKTYQMEKRYYTKDKEVVWVLLSVSLVRGNHDKPLYFVSQVIDITKLHEYQEKLKAKIDELETANQLMVGRELKMIELKKQLGKE